MRSPKAFYCLVNLALLLLALFLQRRAYAVFGALAAGLLLYRHQATLERMLTERLPPTLRRLRPAHAR